MTTNAMTTISLRAGIEKLAPHMAACAGELNAADGRLGDGDLGITMDRGMAALAAIADDLPDDVGLALLECAKEFTKISGSSFGTLFAAGLMSAAKTCKGASRVEWVQVSPLLAGAVEAMMARGKGSLGDKTVLDGLDAVAKASDGLKDPQELLAIAAVAVGATLSDFRGHQSRLGRARMYGEKSAGLDDPGMLALARLIDGLKS